MVVAATASRVPTAITHVVRVVAADGGVARKAGVAMATPNVALVRHVAAALTTLVVAIGVFVGLPSVAVIIATRVAVVVVVAVSPQWPRP